MVRGERELGSAPRPVCDRLRKSSLSTEPQTSPEKSLSSEPTLIFKPPKPDILSECGITDPEEIKYLILKGTEQVIRGTEVILPPEFKATFQREIIVPNTRVLVVYNHQSHTDILPVAKTTKMLTETANEVLSEGSKIPGFRLPIASSLPEGEQGPFLQECINQMIANFTPAFNLSPLVYMRDKDLGLHTNGLNEKGIQMTEQQLRRLRAIKNKEFKDELTKSVDERWGVAVFLPGSVQEGRIGPDGNIYGLGFFNPDFAKIDSMIKRIARINPDDKFCRDVLVIHIGIHGGYKIVSPDTLSLTPDALRAIRNSNDPICEIQATLSLPKRAETIINEIKAEGQEINSETVCHYMLKALAKLLPNGPAQGKYRRYS